MVFHTPRTLRVRGKFAVGFSDTLLVTAGGCEILTPHETALLTV
jgi:Xaa-Pro aminopeptidase